jgi:RibD C-terminal domain
VRRVHGCANELGAAFADAWCAIPKVVFSRTLNSVQGNARLAEASLAEEVAAALDATDKDFSIGGASPAAAAIELGLVDELRVFRNPVIVGGGTPFLPAVTEHVPLNLIETRTLGSRVIYERYGSASMSRLPKAGSRVIRARGRGTRSSFGSFLGQATTEEYGIARNQGRHGPGRSRTSARRFEVCRSIH